MNNLIRLGIIGVVSVGRSNTLAFVISDEVKLAAALTSTFSP